MMSSVNPLDEPEICDLGDMFDLDDDAEPTFFAQYTSSVIPAVETEKRKYILDDKELDDAIRLIAECPTHAESPGTHPWEELDNLIYYARRVSHEK